MSRFLEALHSGRVLLMDGAMGTELQRAGIGSDGCHEALNETHPKSVRAIHQAYADAGAEVFLTNTFQGSQPSLLRRGLEIARSVAGRDRFVLGDIGPILDESKSELYLEVAASLAEADGLLWETHSRWECLAQIGHISRGMERHPPFLLSLTFRRDSSSELATWSGHAPEDFARAAQKCGIAALGVNCGRNIGMEDMIEIIHRYRRETDLPLFARPNAGTPTKNGDHWNYPHTPEAMAARLPELLRAGVSMVGGCCGTTPKHIAAFRPIVAEWNRRP